MTTDELKEAIKTKGVFYTIQALKHTIYQNDLVEVDGILKVRMRINSFAHHINTFRNLEDVLDDVNNRSKDFRTL